MMFCAPTLELAKNLINAKYPDRVWKIADVTKGKPAGVKITGLFIDEYNYNLPDITFKD